MSEERYPMCGNQPAQIDCRKTTCKYHKSGACVNISPAISLLNQGWTCWSFKNNCEHPTITITCDTCNEMMYQETQEDYLKLLEFITK